MPKRKTEKVPTGTTETEPPVFAAGMEGSRFSVLKHPEKTDVSLVVSINERGRILDVLGEHVRTDETHHEYTPLSENERELLCELLKAKMNSR